MRRTNPNKKKVVTAAEASHPCAIRHDWDRIKRDHATGRYTDPELAAKHGVARETISRRRIADRKRNPLDWAVDRTEEVRRTTAALLVHEGVQKTLAAGHDAESVLAAATISRDVILSHRTDVREARDVAGELLTELRTVTTRRGALDAMLDKALSTLSESEATALAAQYRELVKLHSRVGSIQRLADAMTRLQTLERKAFGIGDDEGGSNPLDSMTEEQLEAELERLQAARPA
jgi:hypothetical protein